MKLRWLTAAAVTTITLAALPAHAAPSSVTFTDRAGDWSVPSQDVVKVTMQSTLRGTVHVVSVDITLAAPVGPAYTFYVLGFRNGGTCYGLQAETANGGPAGYAAGGASAVAADLNAVDCTGSGVQQATTAPATVAVHGATVHISADYALGLRPGLRVDDIGVAVGTEPIQSGVFVGTKQVSPNTGDFAFTTALLTLR